MCRLGNLAYPDPNAPEHPFQRSDWIALALLAVVLAAVIGSTGCNAGREMSGVYEFSQPATAVTLASKPNKQEVPRAAVIGRIEFSGRQLTVITFGTDNSVASKIQCDYEVTGNIIHVTPNGAEVSFPMKIQDENTIIHAGGDYRRKS
jgi:hypothetical protein